MFSYLCLDRRTRWRSLQLLNILQATNNLEMGGKKSEGDRGDYSGEALQIFKKKGEKRVKDDEEDKEVK